MNPERIRLLVDEEAARASVPRAVARGMIARQMGLAPGTLENLERGRLKFLDRVEGRINAWLVRRTQREIERLSTELEIYRAAVRDDRDADLVAAVSLIEAARALLRRK